MSKFRKKPVVIDAYRTDVEMKIRTLEGIMKANIGDWIITGVNGEKYPCKDDIFRKTYEKVEKKRRNNIENQTGVVKTEFNGYYDKFLQGGDGND